MNEIKEITEKIKKFRDERDWMKYHNHKDMAVSLLLEAAEVLEHFQWKANEEIASYTENSKDEIAEELADVAIYLFELADNIKIDLSRAIRMKLKKNAKKYPVTKAKGSNLKYNKL
jgi:dCTP diphosphatase